MNTVFLLCMKKIHQVTSLVSLLNIFNSLDNQISARADPSDGQKDIIG